MKALRRLGVAVAVLASTGGCVYGAPRTDGVLVDEDCRSACAQSHATCVRNGEAAKWGLPGVTYELCGRELDDCRSRCRSASAPVLDAGPALPVRAGVGWSEGEARLRCPWESTALSVPAPWTGQVRRISEGEVQLPLAPDAILSMQAGRGAPPPGLEAWLALQSQLTPLAGEASVRMQGWTGAASDWSLDYALGADGGEGRYRAAQHTERRFGAYCLVIAIERADWDRAHSLLGLVGAFGPPTPR